MKTLLITALAVSTAVGVAAAAPSRTAAPKKPAGAGATTRPAAAQTRPASRPAAPPEIRKGMTLAEAERIAGHKAVLRGVAHDEREYNLNVWDYSDPDELVWREYTAHTVDGGDVIIRLSAEYHHRPRPKPFPPVSANRRR